MYILSSSSSSSSKYAHIGFASSSCRQASHNINNIISDCITTSPYYIQLKTKAVPILYCFVTMLYYYSSIRAAGSSCCVTEL